MVAIEDEVAVIGQSGGGFEVALLVAVVLVIVLGSFFGFMAGNWLVVFGFDVGFWQCGC